MGMSAEGDGGGYPPGDGDREKKEKKEKKDKKKKEEEDGLEEEDLEERERRKKEKKEKKERKEREEAERAAADESKMQDEAVPASTAQDDVVTALVSEVGGE